MILSFFGCSVKPISISNSSDDKPFPEEKNQKNSNKSSNTVSTITKEKETQKKNGLLPGQWAVLHFKKRALIKSQICIL